MKKIIYGLVFTICSSVSLGQTAKIISDDSLRVEKATLYLKRKLGDNFVNKNLRYVGTYQDIIRSVTFEIKDSIIKSNRNIIIVFIDGFKIDTTYNTKINSIDLEQYYKGIKTQNIFLNKDTAISIAKKQNLPKGINNWKIELEGVMDEVKWRIYSTEKHSNNKEPYWASGKAIEIDARTGKCKFIN